MRTLKIYLLIIALSISGFTSAQNNIKKFDKEIPFPVCYGSNIVSKSFIPPPGGCGYLKSGTKKKCDIIVSYSLFPKKAKDAFEFAVGIWEGIIESDIPIYIQANWRSLNKNVLGHAGPAAYYAGFKNIPHENVYYPVAIAEKISKSEITGSGSPDILATFSKDIDWYYGIDGNTPYKLYDFVSVVLHEIGHGLGFTGFFYLKDLQGGYSHSKVGDVAAFDLLVERNGIQLTDTLEYKNPSFKLGNAFTSKYLYANSMAATAVNNNKQPRLYSPSEYSSGSSIYHLNDLTYPVGNINSLMTHAVGKGEAIHDPGPLTKGILADIGWQHLYIDFVKPKDIEQVKPIVFCANVVSDIKLDTTSLFVFYSTDNFTAHKDSIPLIANGKKNCYWAELTPQIESGTINYYLFAKDTVGRTFTLPTEAPKTLYKIVIGPDTISPEINHQPISYFLLANKNNLNITATANDNLDIDTVFVEYEINGVSQQPFGLVHDTLTSYSGLFNFNLNQLANGDEITYSINAIDLAASPNKKTVPTDGKFLFKVEKLFAPVDEYINNFNSPSADFVLTDFEIITDTLFKNAALHSPHPYPSPNNNTQSYNFSTILKHPIILHGGGKITFDEIVLVEPCEPQSVYGDDNFWDYVIVEGSKNNGESWLPIADGYDSGKNSTWKINYNKNKKGNNSTTIGVPQWYYNHEIDLLGNDTFHTNDTILIRFRLFSDPFAHGWGWAIDNLRIQLPVSVQTVIASKNILVYPNPFNNVVTVSIQANNSGCELEFNILNSFGQKIYSSLHKNAIGEISHKINLKNFADGMYYIVVQENGKRIFSEKIVKQKN
jgi:hypothetical protein